MKVKKVLAIAGSDSGGCAGIQADIKAISACGVFAMTAITAVTSQNTLGVTYIEELSGASVSSQIDAVMSDMGADAVKSGMLSSCALINVAAERIKHYDVKRYVLDPVMIATSGAKLLKDDAICAVIEQLIPLALVITPNRFEAEELAKMKVSSRTEVEDACRCIYAMGAKYVLIKGGHLEGNLATDTLFDGEKFAEFSSERIATKNLHGTGCTYASAIAAFLAQGHDVPEAVSLAKNYIAGAVRCGAVLDIGGGGAGPVDHFYNLYGRR